MAIRNDFFTEADYEDLESLYGYDTYTKWPSLVLPADYKFDPKNPPFNGCTTFHPPLALTVNDKAVEVYGSSCIKPNITDAHLYISLDRGAPFFNWEQPWENSDRKHVRFFIPDGGVPSNVKQFNKCLDYIVQTLDEGKKVHIGCIAGHGRTGIFLAALAQKTIGDKLKEDGISAIDYVRDTYCANAVENLRQVLFLHGVCGVTPPTIEAKKVSDFKEIFLEDIGVTFEEVAKEDFDSSIPVIRAIESKLYAKNNPVSTYTKPTQKYVNGYPVPSFQSNLPIEPNGTIAMGTRPQDLLLDDGDIPFDVDMYLDKKTTPVIDNRVDHTLDNNQTARTFRQKLDPVKLQKLVDLKLKRSMK
jgi:hypothetical protein